jgi:quercetin dioxygenase-like cupin family protein
VSEPIFRPSQGPGRWGDVAELRYKEEGAPSFRDVTRRVLFEDAGGAQWRYFEVGPGGHTTLERHHHTHAVMILRGGGRCLVGQTIIDVAELDLVSVPPMTWHQFRAAADAPLGFLCLVGVERDRPQLPTPAELEGLRADLAIGAFIRA